MAKPTHSKCKTEEKLPTQQYEIQLATDHALTAKEKRSSSKQVQSFPDKRF